MQSRRIYRTTLYLLPQIETAAQLRQYIFFRDIGAGETRLHLLREARNEQIDEYVEQIVVLRP